MNESFPVVLNISQWQEIDLKVLGELHLDDQNVRLENSDSKVEADLLQDLFANENVLELVSRIASIGLNAARLFNVPVPERFQERAQASTLG